MMNIPHTFLLGILVSAVSLLGATNLNHHIVAHAVVSFKDIAESSAAAAAQVRYDTIKTEVIPIGMPDRSLPSLPPITETQPDIQKPGQRSTSVLLGNPVILQTNFMAMPDVVDIYGWLRIPPDTMGAAGPNHLMVTLNSHVRVQNKNGGVISTVTLNDFWASVNGNTGGGTNGTFDPKIQYDQDEGRFIFTAIDDRDANNGILLGVSATNDPTGTWYLWKIDGDAANIDWADFPSPGYNSKWITVGANMFRVAGGGIGYPKIWLFDKQQAYANNLQLIQIFGSNTFNSFGSVGFTVAPCATFGNEPDLYTVDSQWSSGLDDLVRIGRFTGPVNSPTWILATGGIFGGGFFDVPDTLPPGDAPQLGGFQLIDNGDSRVSAPPVFRNGHVYFAYTGQLLLPSRHVIVWGEFDPDVTAPVNTGIVQNITVPMYYAYPSIAVNGASRIALGFSGFSTGIYASAYFTGRFPSDPAHTMQVPQLLKAGEDYYYKTFGGARNRWGDFSATCVDPADDDVFWTIQEYARPHVGIGVNDDRWGTWWGKIAIIPEPSGVLCILLVCILGRRKMAW
jgi:hypothetical protein